MSEDVKFAIKFVLAVCAAALIIGYWLFGERLFQGLASILGLAP